MVKNQEYNKVLKTKDYGMFKFRKDNRSIISTHVKELTRSMKERGWVPGSLIIVNEKMDIIDGQHRLVSAQQLGIPVEYLVMKGLGEEEMVGQNVSSRNWTKYDFLDSFVKKNNYNYVVLQRFLNKYPDFNITEMMMFLSNSYTSVDKVQFVNGGFRIRDERIAVQWIESIMKLKPLFEKGYNKSHFVRAIVKLLSTKKNEFNIDDFVHKVKLRPGSIFICSNVDQYLLMIENIYNFNRKGGKVNLRF